MSDNATRDSEAQHKVDILDSTEGLAEVEVELEKRSGLAAKLNELKTNKEVRNEFLRYIAVGLGCAVVELSLFTLGDKVLHFPIALSNFIAQGTSVVINFLLSQLWTFKAGSEAKGIVRNIIAYAILFVVNNVVSTTGIHLLMNIGLPSVFAKFIMMGLVVIWNFVLYRTVIFKKK